jgi:hypothetical protein
MVILKHCSQKVVELFKFCNASAKFLLASSEARNKKKVSREADFGPTPGSRSKALIKF